MPQRAKNTLAVFGSMERTLRRAGFKPEDIHQDSADVICEKVGWAKSTFKTFLNYTHRDSSKIPDTVRTYVPTEKEQRAIVENLKEFGVSLCFLGCRWSEMWMLSITKDNQLIIPTLKGGEPVVIDLDSVESGVSAALRKWVSDAPLVSRTRMRRLWASLKDRGLISEQCIPHAFRHKLISNLIEAGADLTQVSKTVGHKNPRTTYRYVHQSPVKNATLRSAVLNFDL